MTMSSPVLAMLWENWRLTRLEAANRLALGIIVGGLAVLLSFRAVPPSDAARDVGATIALSIMIFMTFPLWLSISKLKGGRFLDGYRPGFTFSLLYTRPVRTAVLVGVPMAYQAALAAAMYLVSALVLRWTFGYPFPLLPVAALVAVAHLGQAAGDWSTRSKVVQWLGTAAPVMVLGSLARYRWEGWPGPFDFSLADYALMAAIGLGSYGVAVAGVARQRRGDARVAGPWTAGYPVWLVNRFRFPCPTSSATRAQVWFDLKSSGLPVLAIGVALALVIPLLFVVTTQIDVVLSRFDTRPLTRVVAVVAATFSLPAVLILGGNAFGIRARQGRTYASAFEATQACGTARMAGLKVLVRSVCLLAALVAVGTSVWTSASVIPFDVLGDNDTFIEKSRSPVSGWMRAIEGAVGTMSAYELLALAFVTVIVVAVMVASRAALPALRARYPRRLNIAGSLLLLYGLGFVLIARPVPGDGWEVLFMDALFGATPWLAAAAMVLATVYLFWSVLSERLLRLRDAGGAVLVSAASGAAWVTLLRAAGVDLSAMPATDAVWRLLPALLPLTASVLAPWSLSRIRHT
jgi:hypothetical protein